jgi:hypothetical protein
VTSTRQAVRAVARFCFCPDAKARPRAATLALRTTSARLYFGTRDDRFGMAKQASPPRPAKRPDLVRAGSRGGVRWDARIRVEALVSGVCSRVRGALVGVVLGAMG